jgi:transglutaminase-like putative cysteine protease
MVRFLANITTSVRVRITGPDEIVYQYHINTPNRWEVFTLTSGDGQYTIGIFEQIEGNRFATVLNANISVALTNEFAPFLRPNQFVNFNRNSNAVTQAARVVRGSESVIESVSRVYNFVIENIEYDEVLARNVRSGYTPDIDAVLERGKGICFDYAALMTAMLRSQGIPTKLVIGYVGDLRHAWISVHSEETGWINNIIWFDGREWRVMDPTFAASSGQNNDVMQFIGDGTNHNPTHYH